MHLLNSSSQLKISALVRGTGPIEYIKLHHLLWFGSECHADWSAVNPGWTLSCALFFYSNGTTKVIALTKCTAIDGRNSDGHCGFIQEFAVLDLNACC